MKGIWGTSYGFPGPIPVEPFKDYIRANEYVANHYWNAYPGATTTEIISAAKVVRGGRRAAAHAPPSLDPAAFKTAYEDMLTVDPARPMSRNVSGQAYALTVLTPILDGHAAELTAHLDALPEGDASPLARVPGTHLGRWVVIDQVKYQGHGQRRRDSLDASRLLFTSNFDGELDPYLERLRTGLGEDADAIWGHCRGYPGHRDRRLRALAEGARARGGAVLRRLRRPHGRAGAREPRQARAADRVRARGPAPRAGRAQGRASWSGS